MYVGDGVLVVCVAIIWEPHSARVTFGSVAVRTRMKLVSVVLAGTLVRWETILNSRID